MKIRREVLRSLALASLLVAWISQTLCAQTEIQSSPDRDAAGQPQEIVERLPPLLLLPDEEGKPSVPFVPTFSWDKLNELLQRSRPKDNPHYLIKSMKLDVLAKANHAVIQNTITFSIEKDGTTLVPIEMGSVHLRSPQSEENDEAPSAVRGIRRNREFQGWELVVNAKKNTEHTVTFESQVRLHRLGDETHLRLQLPRVTDSEMSIRVPLPNANARLMTEGMLSQPVERSSNDPNENSEGEEPGGSTTFTIDGLPSEFDFVWFPRSQRPSTDQHSFEVDGNIEVEVDALGGLTADAMLDVTSFNKPIAGVIVKLPAGTRLTNNDLADFGNYELQAIEDDPKSPRRQVRVTFAEADLSPPTIRIKVKSEQELSELELAGFEVLVVEGDDEIQPTSESGVVTVFSEGSLRLDLDPGVFARRVSDDESDTSRNINTFVYSRPNQIRLGISRQSTELEVEPTYIVEIEESSATLTATFRCQKRGGNLDSLTFDLGDWNSYLGIYQDENGIVVRDNLDETLVIELEDAPDNFEISFRARNQFIDSLDADRRELLLTFPTPIGVQQIRQAKVGIVTEDSILATPQNMQAYTETTPTDLIQTFASNLGSNAPLSYLMKARKEPADITVSASKLQGEINVLGDIEITEIDVIDSSVRLSIKETLRWRVDNVALPHAILKMQKEIYDNGNLQIVVDGDSRLRQDVEGMSGFYPSNMFSVRVNLSPQLGAFELELTYDWLYEDMNPQPISDRAETTIELPLVLPRRMTQQYDMSIDLQLKSPRTTGYTISLAQSPDPEPWLAPSDSELVNVDPDVEALLQPGTSSVPSTIPLELRPVEETSADTDFDELVDRAWFQTWLTDTTRIDRAVFRVKGAGRDGVRIRLPNKLFDKLYAMVDGVPTKCVREDDTIELSVDPSTETRVVELQYWLNSREPPGLLTNEVPSVVGAEILGQWYWHIVMPKNETMITWPRSLTRAHHWGWSLIVPNRSPQLSLEELEEWSGATITGDRVLAGSTEYLFGAMGETKTLSIRTTPLPIYVLALAGSVFLLGLLLLYYRSRAYTLAAVGLLIGALIFLHPSYASIAGQVAVFGMLLVLCMTFLRWLAKQTAVRRVTTSPHDSGFELSPTSRKSGSSVVVTTSTTLAAGSSRITQP